MTRDIHRAVVPASTVHRTPGTSGHPTALGPVQRRVVLRKAPGDSEDVKSEDASATADSKNTGDDGKHGSTKDSPADKGKDGKDDADKDDDGDVDRGLVGAFKEII